MNKTSAHSTHLIIAIVLSFFAQSLLLAPEAQRGWLAGLPVIWLYLLGSLAFMTNVMLLVALVLDYSLQRRAIIVVVALLLTGLMISIYWPEKMIAETIILAGAGLGVGAFLTPKVNQHFKLRDFTAILATGLNLLIGIGLLFAPTLIPLQASGSVIPVRIVFGIGLILTALLGFLGFLRPTMARPLYSRMLALPWLLWGALYLSQSLFDKAIVPMTLAFVLALTDNIPWRRLILPINDVLGHWVVRLTAIINVVLLAFISGLIFLAERNLPGSAEMNVTLTLAREAAFVFFNLVSGISIYAVIFVNLTITGLMTPAKKSEGEITTPLAWTNITARFIEPFAALQNSLRNRVSWQEKQLTSLNEQLATERKRALQLALLKELNQQLNPPPNNPEPLDRAVASQLTANAIQRTFGNDLVAIMHYDSESSEFESVAAAGRLSATVPQGYRQSSKEGIIGRAARESRAVVVGDTRTAPDHINLDSQSFLSEIVVPILHNGQMRGMIVVDDNRPNLFDGNDIDTIEAAAVQLLAAWERDEHDRHLKELIQGGTSLSKLLDPAAAIDQIAAIAQQTLSAAFVFVQIEPAGEPIRTASAGYAPQLNQYLVSPPGQKLIREVIEKPKAWCEPDIRKYHPELALDKSNLRAFLGMPIRLRRRSGGTILAFCKTKDVFFTRKDEALIELLASQAAAALDAALYYQEQHAMLRTVEALYQLSTRIIQTEELNEAAAAVAETAKNLSNALAVGIILFDPQKKVEAQVQIDATGLRPGNRHPLELIYQTVETGEILKVATESLTRITLPIKTQRRQYGVMWLELPKLQTQDQEKLKNLANQAAIALERSILLIETRAQAEKIKAAFDELQLTYDQTLRALTAALDARDHETEGHSMRVTKMSLLIAESLGLDAKMLEKMERGALLHDIGKIGISDNILLKPGRLTEDEWKIMRLHPEIGARIIGDIPFLQDAMEVVRYHHERWNGQGYPMGLKGADIPVLARIFSVADVFDALTSIRPYRQRNTPEEALEHIQKQSGIEFDPEIVDTMTKLVKSGRIKSLVVPA